MRQGKRRMRINKDGSITYWIRNRGRGTVKTTVMPKPRYKIKNGVWVPIDDDE